MKLTPQLMQFVKEHKDDDIQQLALQVNKYPSVVMSQVIQQIVGRRIAKSKIPNWYMHDNIIYPRQLSLEQCSSEHTAKYKASLCKGKSMVDLTGGMGIDFSFMSQRFEHAAYVEQQKELVDIASHNFNVLKLNNINIALDTAKHYLDAMSEVDLIYIDPARRNNVGHKTVSISDCTPNIIELENLLENKAKHILVKLSPMLDISIATNELKNISDVYIISHDNECKELLFLKKKTSNDMQLHCVNIQKEQIDNFTFTPYTEKECDIEYTTKLGKYLYEPNSSILKAGAYKIIGKKFKLKKLHANSHLYTSDEYNSSFHGRKFEIISFTSLNKKMAKTHLLGIEQANITIRNFPLTVDSLRKRLNLKDGGNVYIFGTTLADNKKILILCKRL